LSRSDPVPYLKRKSRRLCKSLQPGRDIDGIAKEIVGLNDNVADVDADAESHLLGGRST
jgi:hypothetical protein